MIEKLDKNANDKKTEKNSELETYYDVIILGGGFSGMHAALLLAEHNIKPLILDIGQGASSFWAGTFDFLKTTEQSLAEAYLKFTKDVPSHPYNLIGFEECQSAFDDFSARFQEFKFFKSNTKNLYENRMVITPLGLSKPCIGCWHSVFDFSVPLDKNNTIVLIEFKEFPNSTASLIAKGLSERFTVEYRILSLSLSSMIPEKTINSQSTLAKLMDSDRSIPTRMATELKRQLDNNSAKNPITSIKCILFPPVLGLLNTKSIIQTLSEEIGIQCFEILALVPSVMADRLKSLYLNELNKHQVETKKIKEIMRLDIRDFGCEMHVRDNQMKIQALKTEQLIIATGSLFAEAPFYDQNSIKEYFNAYGIKIPNSLRNFQLEISQESLETNAKIYVIGSALYNFCGAIADDDEIQAGSGLGLSISSSFKACKELINRK